MTIAFQISIPELHGTEGTIEAEKEFLLILQRLEDHFGLYVAGCGCCDSPYLTTLPSGQSSNKYLTPSR